MEIELEIGLMNRLDLSGSGYGAIEMNYQPLIVWMAVKNNRGRYQVLPDRNRISCQRLNQDLCRTGLNRCMATVPDGEAQ